LDVILIIDPKGSLVNDKDWNFVDN